MLYAGEQFDDNLGQYYLRARYYNPLNGTFNRMDPHPGNNQDPQSLHKYLYCHNNPINATDPSGLSISVGGWIAIAVIALVVMVILAVYVAPPAYRTYRVARFMMDSYPMAGGQIEVAVRAGNQYWLQNTQWNKLTDLLEDPYNPLIVMVGPTDRIGGLHHWWKQGYVYVSQNAVDDSNLAVAYTIFAEWQHDRILGEGLGEEEAQEHLQRLVELVPEVERGEFINNYGHGWGY